MEEEAPRGEHTALWGASGGAVDIHAVGQEVQELLKELVNQVEGRVCEAEREARRCPMSRISQQAGVWLRRSKFLRRGVKDLYFGTVDTSTANWSGSIREVHGGIC